MEQKLGMLIVDDFEINRAILRSVFKEEYEIIEAEDGQEAFQILQENRKIDVILLDIVMPKMDGIQLLKILKADERTSHIPVIVNSQMGEQENELECLELGADDFISKPYKAQILKRRVSNLVQKYLLEKRLKEQQEIRLDTVKDANTLRKLRIRAERDWLTGIYNRETFYEKTEQILQQNPDEEYVIILWNIDHFKVVNELFGSSAGDALLSNFAQILQRQFRGEGIYGRLEADWFSVCTSKEKLDQKWDEVESLLKNGISVPDMNYTLYLRVGLYRVEERDCSVDVMCDRARMAAHMTQGSYISRWAYYHDGLKDSMLNEQALENEMEKALTKGEFYIEYQPIFSAKTNELVSAEALVRWRHPQKGLISPANFIPLFEKNGFITRLDSYVWENVCHFLKENEKKGIPNVPISVNVSRVNLYKKDLDEYLENLVKKIGVNPSFLKLEITESVYTENPQQLLSAMAKLKKKNFKILMDDFGSGYSSLNMLKDVPVDFLKIDMKFMDTLDSSERAGKILYNIIQMAHGLDMEVVAEGVENENQFELLKRMGCDNIQGYYFSKPMESKEFVSKILCRSKIRESNAKTEHQRTVLIVDDQQFNLRLTADALQEDYIVLQAKDGQEALNILNTDASEIDLVITDLVMPEMDGFALLGEMKKSTYLKHIPVIVLSALDKQKSESKALKLGAVDVLMKPFEPDILRRRVENILKVAANDHAQAELHALQKSAMLRQKLTEMLKDNLMAICHMTLREEEEFQMARVSFANPSFCQLHNLVQANLTAVTRTESMISNMDPMERERVASMIRQAISQKKHQIQVFYHLVEHTGNIKAILCNVQFEYHQEEVCLKIAEQQAFRGTMFERPAVLESFAVKMLQDTDLDFWNYHIAENKLVHYPPNFMKHRHPHTYKDVDKTFVRSTIFERSDWERIERMHARVRKGEKTVQEIFWCRMIDKNGKLTTQNFWNKITYHTILDEYGTPVCAIGISENVTNQIQRQARKEKNDFWNQMALPTENQDVVQILENTGTKKEREIDKLTGLLTQRTFADHVNEILNQQGVHATISAFILLDVDNFKEMNRKYGRNFGDKVLETIARQIRRTFRNDDYIGRISSDKFAIFIPYAASKEVVQRRAETLCKNVRVSFMQNDGIVSCTCSVGVAFCPEDGEDFHVLYGKADSALYFAKQQGKNRCSTVQEIQQKKERHDTSNADN
ncbi:MAG: EAL domain-containing protein [Lachnospiraceae bacterium]